MKRSNIILIILLACLYVVPLIVWGVYSIRPEEDIYTGFRGSDITLVKIDNAQLKPEDVIIGTPGRIGFPGNDQIENAINSYLYYEANGKKYLPKVNVKDNVLIIGKSTDIPGNEKARLHIHINGIKEIQLNNTSIWEEKYEIVTD